MIKIVTDSTAYLSEATTREHDIRVVPLYVHFGEEAFKEGVEISDKEFYARLKEAPTLPTTSQPSAGEFHQVFEELTEAGHEIVTLTISSKLSGTWNSAMAAKEMLPGANISVVDTFSTAVGLHLMVNAAIEAAAAGTTREEIVERIEEIKKTSQLWFVVDTLEYLAKGGRIGNARAFMGTLLKVKPILTLQDGAIEPCEQVRSKPKALARMIEIAQEYVGSKGPQAKVAVLNALVPEEADALGHELVERMGCAPPLVGDLGPVIGTHTGPGVVGIALHL
ncbi:MAG: DegV family protein [Anaerolineae bacterium]|jgi:DegV family protein with EDD domain